MGPFSFHFQISSISLNAFVRGRQTRHRKQKRKEEETQENCSRLTCLEDSWIKQIAKNPESSPGSGKHSWLWHHSSHCKNSDVSRGEQNLHTVSPTSTASSRTSIEPDWAKIVIRTGKSAYNIWQGMSIMTSLKPLVHVLLESVANTNGALYCQLRKICIVNYFFYKIF